MVSGSVSGVADGCMVSGSVTGVADGSVLLGCDAVPDASIGRVASIFRVKQSCWTALSVCQTLRLSR